jgi:tetratricopeptide (TPR) repeat protein
MVLFTTTIFLPMVALAQAEEKLPVLIARVRPSVVRVSTYDANGNRIASGTGFCVALNRVVTNKHVIADAKEVELRSSDGKRYGVKRWSVDPTGDLALLETEVLDSSVQPIRLANSEAKVGDPVIIIGNPLGLEGTVSNGIVSGIRTNSPLGKMLQITAPISSGSSGSPVINSRGELVGIATLTLVEGQNLNFAISSERLRALWPDVVKTAIALESTESEASKLLNPLEEWYKAAVGYFNDRTYDEVLRAAQKMIAIAPGDMRGVYMAGLAYDGLKRHGEAIESFKKAAEMDMTPSLRSKSVTALAMSYYRNGDVALAYKEKDLLLTRQPADGQTLWGMLRNITGYWRSAPHPYSYKIVDNGKSITIHNWYKDNGEIKYEAKWDGDLAIGTIHLGLLRRIKALPVCYKESR